MKSGQKDMGHPVYKCTSRKQFTIERYHSLPKEGVVALLVDHGKFGTYVNNKQSLSPNSRTGIFIPFPK